MFREDYHIKEVQQLELIKERVIFHAKPAPRNVFNASRWPYTYAADFVRAHEAIIPSHIWDAIEISGSPSRAQASQARTRWANALGLLDVDVAEMLACGYIIEHGVNVTCSVARTLVPTWVHARTTSHEEKTA